jgi:hypothetical protein
MRYALLTFGLMLTTTALAADTGAPGGARNLQALDTDGDRQISLAEAQAGAPELAARFGKMDANHDGYLSIDEVLGGRPAGDVLIFRSMPEDFAAADANADGQLSRTEAANMPVVSDLFEEMDSNADGQVTQAEIHQHAKKHGPIRVMKEIGPGMAKQ